MSAQITFGTFLQTSGTSNFWINEMFSCLQAQELYGHMCTESLPEDSELWLKDRKTIGDRKSQRFGNWPDKQTNKKLRGSCPARSSEVAMCCRGGGKKVGNPGAILRTRGKARKDWHGCWLGAKIIASTRLPTTPIQIICLQGSKAPRPKKIV